jgi:hypothetical protein
MPTGMSFCALSQALWHAGMLGSKALACWHVTPLHNTGAGLSQGSRVLPVLMAETAHVVQCGLWQLWMQPTALLQFALRGSLRMQCAER